MSVIEVKVKNLKVLKGEHTLTPDGKSFVIVGDTAEGKTTILNIIAAHMMQEDYPSFPLSEGENEGFSETKHKIDGIVYAITRKFKRKEDGSVQIDRFSVRSEKGGKYTLTDFLKTLSGSFTAGSKFDYSKYFFEMKSQESRYKYLIDSIGGTEVYANNQKIKELESERAATGQQRSTQKTIWEQEGIFSPETAERDIEYYKEPKTNEEAVKAKNEILATRLSVKEVSDQLTIVKQNHFAIQQLSAEVDVLAVEVNNLSLLLEAAKNKLEVSRIQLLNLGSIDINKQLELEKQLNGVESHNETIEFKANEQFEEDMNNISLFNTKRQNFMNTVTAFRNWQRFDNEWNSTDKSIKDIREQNKNIFKSKLPIPELTIGEVGGKETVLYNGREFSWDNLSKGETIKITAQIQNALNPNGDNFIIIPEAQSLGSQLDEIIAECEKFGMQACIEYTERNEEFKMEFIDEFMTKK